METKKLILTALFTVSLLVLFTSVNSGSSKVDFQEEVELSKNNYGILTPTPMFMYETIEKYSDEYGIPKYIAYNISFLETRYLGPFHWRYNPSQTSSAGALGPMQIMPGTAKLIQKVSIPRNTLKNDIELNVKISMKLLRKLYNKYHNWAIVCGCYNTGKPIVNGYAKYCVTNLDYQNKWIGPSSL